MTRAFQISLHELRRICGAHETLPKSCTIPVSLQIDSPVDLGPAREGILNGAKVRVRCVRMHSNGDPRRAKKVCRRLQCISNPSLLMNLTGFQPISCGVETLEPPKYSPPSGCHCRSSTTRFGLDALRGSPGIYHESYRRGQTWPRRCSPTASHDMLTLSVVRHR